MGVGKDEDIGCNLFRATRYLPSVFTTTDIRNVIYRLILPSEPIKPRSDSRIRKPRFFNLFLVNRQIYNEASHVLYSEGRSLISVGPDKIFFLRHGTLWGSLLEGYFHIPHESLARRIRNVVIEIYWPKVTLGRQVKARTFWRENAERFEDQMVHIYSGLRLFECLRSIVVTWRAQTLPPGCGEPVFNTIARPSASVSRMIMKPLEQFQKYSPDTVIRVQDAGELVLGRTGGGASYKLLSVFVREMEEETGTR